MRRIYFILFLFFIFLFFDFSIVQDVFCVFVKDGVVYNSSSLPKDDQVVYIGVLSYTKEVNFFFVGPYKETLEFAQSCQVKFHQEHYPLFVIYKEREFLDLIRKVTDQDILCLIYHNKFVPGGAWKIVGKPMDGDQYPFLMDFLNRHMKRS